MDPVSISGFVAGVLPLAYQVAAGIFGFAVQAHDNSETLNGFASEIQSLTRILEAATSTINDANPPAQPDGGPSTAVYRALHGAVDDIRLYLERLRRRVQRIQGDSANTNLYRNAIRIFATRINRTGINDLRSLLQTHQLSLNTALVMVHLYHATHAAGHQQTDLRPDIYRLTSIVQRLATAVDRERLRDDLTNYRIHDLQSVALQVVEDAAASTAGSEMGEPIDPRARRRIDEWLNQNVSEGSYHPDLGSRGSHEASTSHSQIPSIQLQHRSSLGSDGHQTQPTSSDNNREATTNTETTRPLQTSNSVLRRIFSALICGNTFQLFVLFLALLIGSAALISSVATRGAWAFSTLGLAIITLIGCLIRLAYIQGRDRINTRGFIVDFLLG